MAGTNKNQPNITEGPVIILVEPQLPENIGMAARAMANFGLVHLRLVNPRESFPNEKAIAAASKADHIIESCEVFSSLSAAVGDLSLLFATTARARYSYKPVKSPTEAARILRSHSKSAQKAGILFGRERWGLNNEELSLTDQIVTFPVNPAFASLNIAQAVLLMSYEWMKAGLAKEEDTAFRHPALAPADKADLYGLFDQLENALEARGYFRPPERKEIMLANLRAILVRPAFAASEIRLLRGVIASLEHFSPEVPRGSAAPKTRARVPKTSILSPTGLAPDND
ncbi:RNA methyltransferase [Bartonella sp. DGB2]|uniref:RNA methyltransferase n=1 Tax=Bartonella sp. DGB2 TaxID=3388426 RepID=UPI00398F9ED0